MDFNVLMMRKLTFIFACLIITANLIAQNNQKISGKSQFKPVHMTSGPSSGLGAAPDLIIKDELFKDPDSNNVIDANQQVTIKFKIENIGVGEAKDVMAKISQKGKTLIGLSLPPPVNIGTIKPGEIKNVSFPIEGKMNLENGLAEFKIEVTESLGFDAYPLEMKIETHPFQAPQVVVADAVFSTEKGGKIQTNQAIQLKILIQNVGKGAAGEVKASCILPNANCFPLADDKFDIGIMKPGDTHELDFSFITNRRFEGTQIPIRLSLSEKEGKFARDTIVTVGLDQTLVSQNKVLIAAIPTTEVFINKASLTSDVDKNIPVFGKKDSLKFALIIGNEDYSKYQLGLSTDANVIYARNDAMVFKEYLIKTLGFLEINVYLLLDATTGEMNQKIDLISKRANKAGNEAQLVFYYAGHGLPDESTKIPYIIPVDVNGTNLNSAISLATILQKFGETGASRITIILDACFSGGGREAGLLAARGVRFKPTENTLSGNMVLFSASSGDQTALPFNGEHHGLYTYYLLKKMKETSGNISYKNLVDYLTKTVSSESLRINQKEQDPTVQISPEVTSQWESWKLR